MGLDAFYKLPEQLLNGHDDMKVAAAEVRHSFGTPDCYWQHLAHEAICSAQSLLWLVEVHPQGLH